MTDYSSPGTDDKSHTPLEADSGGRSASGGAWLAFLEVVAALTCVVVCGLCGAVLTGPATAPLRWKRLSRSGGAVWSASSTPGTQPRQRFPSNRWRDLAFARGGKDFVEGVAEAEVRNDAGLRAIGALPQIERLELWFSNVTDRGVANVAQLKRLRWLSLEASKITDDSLRYVAALPRLERLVLADTAVTDDGLEFLRVSTHLKYLNLEGTRVTPEGVRRLGQALPNCRIETVPYDAGTR